MIEPRITEAAIHDADCYALSLFGSKSVTRAMIGPSHDRKWAPGVRDAYNAKINYPGLAEAICRQTMFPRRAVEPSEVVMYPPGGKFAKHQDGKDRAFTMITVLNNFYQGGELCLNNFHPIDLSKLPIGTTILFDSDRWHWSQEVTQGVKWIAVTWVKKLGSLEGGSVHSDTSSPATDQ